MVTTLHKSFIQFLERMMEIRYSQVCFLPVFLFINGVSLQETVVGFIGGSAVLPCSSKDPPHTIQGIGVYWRHSSQNVYGIIYGKVSVEGQDPEYRNRTESFPEEYMRGNFSIKLNNLQHTDAGEYKCYIIEESVVWRVKLLIKERPERPIPSEGTKPKPEMIVMIISVLFIGIIFSLAVFTVSLQETVVGFIGGSAVLPCSSKDPPHTIQGIGVYWRHSSQNVYGIIYGKVSVEGQDPEYRNRTESFPEEYMRGNFSIKLNNLQHTDAGEYKCYIIEESVVWRVKLLIKERPERPIPSEGTKPKPEMIVMIISVLFIGIIFSLAVSLFSNIINITCSACSCVAFPRLAELCPVLAFLLVFPPWGNFFPHLATPTLL
ncbi:uncharacterized protein LOC107719949 [Sinocyclocheilus rhinocerous]|uniref:uncharacterized protein LOC107719949 n=1 Tax=Sinocyclocheilus rhinocerous TaxID=307959 RepID=UPI0007B85609|nr:PREDICTED: uncharacterized protein LOC107719949 [Sinocyclocheilus rhinocerous]